MAQETHAVAQRKQEQMARLRGAFGFDAEGPREGEAFNRELQEQRREEARAEREAKERERKCVGCRAGARGEGPSRRAVVALACSLPCGGPAQALGCAACPLKPAPPAQSLPSR